MNVENYYISSIFYHLFPLTTQIKSVK